jgi:putative transposase
MIGEAIDELTDEIGVGLGAACTAVGRPRSSHYRWTHPMQGPPASRKGQAQPQALSEAEREQVLAVLRDERFVDQAPPSVYATLLDEGEYLCSISTMYRLLREQGETGERRRQATHPATVKPELQADRPNAVWSWDITKLLGAAKWTYYYLYVIIDIYSRYVPGWLLADRPPPWPSSCWVTPASARTSITGSCPSTPIVAVRCPPSPSRCCCPISG